MLASEPSWSAVAVAEAAAASAAWLHQECHKRLTHEHEEAPCLQIGVSVVRLWLHPVDAADGRATRAQPRGPVVRDDHLRWVSCRRRRPQLDGAAPELRR